MNTSDRSTIVAVFESRANADRAIAQLHDAGFNSSQIGVVGRDPTTGEKVTTGTAADKGEKAAVGAATGAAVGAGAGGLIALGILSGVIPGIGPAIAAGTLGMVLSNVGLGAAAVGIGGALAGLGIPDEDAKHYESEFNSGRTIVTVNDSTGKAWAILQRNGGYNRQTAATNKRMPASV